MGGVYRPRFKPAMILSPPDNLPVSACVSDAGRKKSPFTKLCKLKTHLPKFYSNSGPGWRPTETG
jgi:hypothetical protein